jgi:adenylate cyclase
VWSQRYDRDLKDLFALQDDITMEILMAMRVKLTEGEQVSRAKRPRNIDTALKCYEAWGYFLRWTPEASAMAKKLAEEVVAMEPDWGEGYWTLSATHMRDIWFGTTKSRKESFKRAIEFAEKAISLDDSLTQALGQLGYLYGMMRDYDKAIAFVEKAVAKDPNGALVHLQLGICLMWAERAQEAIALYEKAMRLNPFPPAYYYGSFGHCLRIVGRHEDAIAQYRKALALSPNDMTTYLGLCTTYVEMGREDEARAAAAEVMRINPKFTVDYWAKTLPFKDRDYCKQYGENLRKAGLK